MSALAPVSWAVEVFCPFLGCFGFLFVCFFYCGHSPTARAAAMAGAATNARGAASWVAKAAFYIQPKSGKFIFFRKPWETLALFWHLGVWTLRVSVVASQPWTSGAANHGLKVLGNVSSRLISAGKLEETSAGVKKKTQIAKIWADLGNPQSFAPTDNVTKFGVKERNQYLHFLIFFILKGLWTQFICSYQPADQLSQQTRDWKHLFVLGNVSPEIIFLELLWFSCISLQDTARLVVISSGISQPWGQAGWGLGQPGLRAGISHGRGWN